MNAQELNRRCVELFHRPDAKLHYWHPRVFWSTHMVESPKPEDLQEAKVDLHELEVMLAEAAGEISQCAQELDRGQPGQSALIRHMMERGEMPLLHRPH